MSERAFTFTRPPWRTWRWPNWSRARHPVATPTRTWVIAGLAGLLAVVALLALGVGAVPIAPRQVVAVVGRTFGLPLAGDIAGQEAVLLTIRAPRVLLAALVGASLAVAGAAMQGLFRNPLADPGLIGVSSGAALGAVAMIVLGGDHWALLGGWLGIYALPTAAFGCGFLATWLVARLANREGHTRIATLLLAGIAINTIAGAGVGLLIYLADDEQLRTLTFWSMGSLGGATWRQLAVAAPPILLTIVLIPRHARLLNALLLGDREAGHLGFAVERAKRLLLALTALAVGTAVAMTGIIGFVGLVVPHLLRLTWGADHRLVLPGSALLGGALVIGADILARTVVAPAELPIGTITALLGGPFFLWLLWRYRRQGDL